MEITTLTKTVFAFRYPYEDIPAYIDVEIMRHIDDHWKFSNREETQPHEASTP